MIKNKGESRMIVQETHKKDMSKKWDIKIMDSTNTNIFVDIIALIICFLVLVGMIIMKITEKKKKLMKMLHIKLDIKKQIIRKTYSYELKK